MTALAVSITEPPPTATIASNGSRVGEGDRVEKRFVGRLDAHAIVERVRILFCIERLEHGLHRRQPRKHGIGDDQHAARAHLGQVHADFARHAGAEADAGNGHLEGDVFAHRQPIMDQDAATVSDRGSRTLM